MKRIIATSIILFAVIIAVAFDNSIGGFEFYGIIYCKSDTACVHERGHALDTKLGIPSLSYEFRHAVTEYTNSALLTGHRTEYSDTIMVFPGVNQPKTMNGFASQIQGGWGGYTELYATIYEIADGDIDSIPAELQQFYRGD